VEQTTNELNDLAKEAGKGGSCIGVVADMREGSGVQKLIDQTLDRFGGVDCLLNNVGGSKSGPFLEITDDEYIASWSLRLLAAIRLTRALTPIMAARGGGAIVNIGGMDSRAERILAATTSGATRAFTKAIAPYLAERGISINILSLGVVRSGRTTVVEAQPLAESEGMELNDAMESIRANMPTGHIARPEEIAELILFLASQRVYNLTGNEIIVDGAASLAAFRAAPR
jgi:NAD(P)-dependent dehydrogenase (short-subunit alcohol dehydrogenase family)